LKLILEGLELTQAIRRGVDFDLPRDADITIITGRGSNANADRAEIEWALNSGAADAPAEEEEPPFEVAERECAEEVDPAQQALPLEDVADGEEKDPFA
jgi:hypothetical protein